MIKILIDTNIILDIALDRNPFSKDARKMFEYFDDHREEISGYISASSLSDIYFIISKFKNKSIALNFIKDLVILFDIASVNKAVIFNAINSDFSDFEDAIQESSAFFSNVDIIVTRNEKDFTKSRIKVINPRNFIEIYQKNKRRI